MITLTPWLEVAVQPDLLEWAGELGGELSYAPSAARMQLPLVPSRSDVRALLECQLLSPLQRLALRTLYATGMRGEELFELELLENGRLQVAGRMLAADGATLEELGQLGGALFEGECLQDLQSWLEVAAGAVGVLQRFQGAGRPLSPRALRHAYASHCLDDGMDLITLYYLLGHGFLETTQMYLETSVGRLSSAYEQYHPLQHWDGEVVDRGGLAQAKISIGEAMGMIGATVRPQDRLVLRVLYGTALREAELLALRYADLEVGERRLFVRSGKGPRDRYTLIDLETVRLLQEWRGSKGLGAPIFDIKSHMTLDNIVKRMAIKTGIWEKYKAARRSLSPHTFRHAYASHCYQQGMDLNRLGRLMGHSFVQNTLTYAHCPPEMQQQSYERSHPLARSGGAG